MFVLFRRQSALKRRSAASGRRALITGASSGIGKAAALYLAERGFSVFATSRRAARLHDLSRQAAERSLDIIPVELDINNDEAVSRAVPELIARHGAIDALVNNAGYGLWGPVEALSVDELKAQFETNLFAAIRMTHAVLPAMIERRSGVIINISSVLGRMGTPFNGAYVSSKFALEGISESLKTELAPFGVHVALIEPGLFRTNFPANTVRARATDDDQSVYEPYMARYRDSHDLFRRFGGDPQRVAKLIYKLSVSPAPPFRNPIGLDARAGTLGARLLPQAIYWRLLQRATLGGGGGGRKPNPSSDANPSNVE